LTGAFVEIHGKLGISVNIMGFGWNQLDLMGFNCIGKRNDFGGNSYAGNKFGGFSWNQLDLMEVKWEFLGILWDLNEKLNEI
jgi:hypothetical protein